MGFLEKESISFHHTDLKNEEMYTESFALENG